MTLLLPQDIPDARADDPKSRGFTRCLPQRMAEASKSVTAPDVGLSQRDGSAERVRLHGQPASGRAG